MSGPAERWIGMGVDGLVVDKEHQAPVVVLRGESDPTMVLPIFIGGAEAAAIATVLGGIESPRPMTHDLMASMLAHLQVTVHRVRLTDIKQGTFYAEVVLADPQGHEWVVDARPSDCLALALRTGTPIQVSTKVLEQAGTVVEVEQTPPDATPSPVAEVDSDDEPQLAVSAETRLEDLDPELFGKYKQ